MTFYGYVASHGSSLEQHELVCEGLRYQLETADFTSSQLGKPDPGMGLESVPILGNSSATDEVEEVLYCICDGSDGESLV